MSWKVAATVRRVLRKAHGCSTRGLPLVVLHGANERFAILISEHENLNKIGKWIPCTWQSRSYAISGLLSFRSFFGKFLSEFISGDWATQRLAGLYEVHSLIGTPGSPASCTDRLIGSHYRPIFWNARGIYFKQVTCRLCETTELIESRNFRGERQISTLQIWTTLKFRRLFIKESVRVPDSRSF